MIDTIKIRLPLKEATYEIGDKFHPIPLRDIYWSTKTHISTLFNPGKSIAKNTIYTPTYIGEKYLVNGEANFCLGIELSLPKLLFGNNVEELAPGEESLSKILNCLSAAILRDIGMKYSSDELLRSEVVKLHVGKNFIFDDPGAPTFIIDTLYKSRADRICDNSKVKYENLGSAFKMHTNNKEAIYYDKKKDLEKSFRSLKRAIDQTTTDEAKKEDSPIDQLLSDNSSGILRLEVRLNKRRLIRQAFPSIGNDLSFKNVYLNAPVMQYLKLQWAKATENISMVRLGKTDVCTSFEAVAANGAYSNSLRDSLAVAAAIQIINEHGLNYLRSIAEKYYKRDAWYRFSKHVFVPESFHPLYLKKVTDELEDYTPIRLQSSL